MGEGGEHERLARYTEILLAHNASLNLTGARSVQEVAQHVEDSLTLLPYVKGTLLDVGSGGGFPAIPLAIASGCAVTLIESVAKKARFLEFVVESLALRGRVVCARAEAAAHRPELRGQFSVATARAVASLPTVLELTLPFLEIGGIAALQRGALEGAERTSAEDAALVLGCELVAEEAVGRASARRRILLFQKMTATPPRFPRRAGVPGKRPLCDRHPRKIGRL